MKWTAAGQGLCSVSTRPRPLTLSNGKRSKVYDQESVDDQTKINEEVKIINDNFLMHTHCQLNQRQLH